MCVCVCVCVCVRERDRQRDRDRETEGDREPEIYYTRYMHDDKSVCKSASCCRVADRNKSDIVNWVIDCCMSGRVTILLIGILNGLVCASVSA